MARSVLLSKCSGQLVKTNSIAKVQLLDQRGVRTINIVWPSDYYQPILIHTYNRGRYGNSRHDTRMAPIGVPHVARLGVRLRRRSGIGLGARDDASCEALNVGKPQTNHWRESLPVSNNK
eukprot:130876-Pleurochrysis_carterae.AAC.1